MPLDPTSLIQCRQPPNNSCHLTGSTNKTNRLSTLPILHPSLVKSISSTLMLYHTTVTKQSYITIRIYETRLMSPLVFIYGRMLKLTVPSKLVIVILAVLVNLIQPTSRITSSGSITIYGLWKMPPTSSTLLTS